MFIDICVVAEVAQQFLQKLITLRIKLRFWRNSSEHWMISYCSGDIPRRKLFPGMFYFLFENL